MLLAQAIMIPIEIGAILAFLATSGVGLIAWFGKSMVASFRDGLKEIEDKITKIEETNEKRSAQLDSKLDGIQKISEEMHHRLRNDLTKLHLGHERRLTRIETVMEMKVLDRDVVEHEEPTEKNS